MIIKIKKPALSIMGATQSFLEKGTEVFIFGD